MEYKFLLYLQKTARERRLTYGQNFINFLTYITTTPCGRLDICDGAIGMYFEDIEYPALNKVMNIYTKFCVKEGINIRLNVEKTNGYVTLVMRF